MMPAVVEQISDAHEWLTHLFADCEGWISLFSLDRIDGTQHVDWAPAVAPDQAARIAGQRAPRCCVWFGVATRHQHLEGKRRGGADDCLHIPALWADFDVEGPNHKGGHALPPTIDAAAHLVKSFPLPPTAVVRSGGGLQGWWFFHEPLTINDQSQALLRAWGATWVELARRQGWHVDNVFDVARIMRLPGTWNRKNEPAPVTAKAIWDRRYNPSDFEPHLLEPPAPPDPAPARIPYIGPERPGDAFNAVRNGGDILGRAGFTYGRRSGDEDHWTHPFKPVKEGTSATVYPDGHTTLWSDTIIAKWPQVQLRRPYDPFGLYTVLFHNGDFTASSDTLLAEGYGSKARADDDLSWVPATAWPAPATTNGTVATADPAAQPDPYLQRAVLIERARRQARRILDIEEAHTAPLEPGEPDPDIHQLFLQPEPDYRWLIPNILERGDRVILTGPEGGGKSTFLRQLAVQTTAGIHPFTEDDTDPLTVLYIDLENSRRQTLRQFTPLIALVPGRIAARALIPVMRPEGLDLLTTSDRLWLEQRIEANQPDLLIIGPLYKLALGDPVAEEVARHVAFVLDAFRATYDLAMLIEAHQPHGTNGGHRPDRPYGASLWLRWPEFGLNISVNGFVSHWRGPRDERQWPTCLRRGGSWPWTPATIAQATYVALVEACRDAGHILTERELTMATGIPKTTVHRALEANRPAWNLLAQELPE